MLTTKEAAVLLRVKDNQLATSIRTGHLQGIDLPPSTSDGSRRYYSMEGVRDYLKRYETFTARWLDKPALCARLRVSGRTLNHAIYSSGMLFCVELPESKMFPGKMVRWDVELIEEFERAVEAHFKNVTGL